MKWSVTISPQMNCSVIPRASSVYCTNNSPAVIMKASFRANFNNLIVFLQDSNILLGLCEFKIFLIVKICIASIIKI